MAAPPDGGFRVFSRTEMWLGCSSHSTNRPETEQQHALTVGANLDQLGCRWSLGRPTVGHDGDAIGAAEQHAAGRAGEFDRHRVRLRCLLGEWTGLIKTPASPWLAVEAICATHCGT